MNNIYINLIFGAIVATVGVLPGVGEAYTYDDISYGGYTTPASVIAQKPAINIVNNNYNNNINNPTTLSSNNVRRVKYIYSRAHVGTYGSVSTVVGVDGLEVSKPLCTLVPAITQAGDVQLQWTIKGATIAYIDSGIGHIAPTSGSMIVTPTKDTTYNLTALNDAGIASSCVAKVNVTIDDTPVDPVDPVDPTDPTDPTDPSGGSSLFGDTFRSIALPIGVAFLILIILLIVIMSKVKNSG